MTKMRNGALAILLTFMAIVVFSDNVPRAWFSGGGGGGTGNDDDDDSRSISLVALADNETLRIDAVVHSDLRGRVLEIDDLAVDDNGWHFDYQAQRTENMRITLNAWVFRYNKGDRTGVRCRIMDDGRKVDERKMIVPDHRQGITAECNYAQY